MLGAIRDFLQYDPAVRFDLRVTNVRQLNSSLPVFVLAVTLAGGCTDSEEQRRPRVDGSDTSAGRDGGRFQPSTRDASVDAQMVRDASLDDVSCDASAPRLQFEVEGYLSTFVHTASSCETLVPTVAIRNVGSERARIDEIRVSSPLFRIGNVELPRAIESGDVLEFTLGLQSTEHVDIEASIAIAGPDGCIEIDDVVGIAVDEPLISQSAYAIDFGKVQAGTASSVREYVVRFQAGSDRAVTSIPSEPSATDPFDVSFDSAFAQPFSSCEDRIARIVFNAPPDGGRKTGLMAYTVTTTGSNGTAEARIAVFLSGESVLE